MFSPHPGAFSINSARMDCQSVLAAETTRPDNGEEAFLFLLRR
jgi:hypothetical protein